MYDPRMVRVRFAPSPTGFLHIGGARTALFNWLFARRHGGIFILRIEDTDAERSSWDLVAGIVDGLRWLGLDWDEGPDVGGPHEPYFQSQRLDRYRALADQLLAAGKAYHCYCTTEELQAKRSAAEAAGGGWIYDRTCCALSAEEIAAREAEGRPRAVRFKVPEGHTAFEDLIRGSIRFDNPHIEDFVILRSDRQPTYHLSVVADDVAMGMTHVVRGDDHISNTPKQVLLYRAFDAHTPLFAHVPLIMGPDKKRLSKRHGATSVMEYPALGYLPEAMVNFLALLGWSPGDDQELFTREELVGRFDLTGISGGNAVFNPEKLDWFNQQYIARLDPGTLAGLLEPGVRQAGLWQEAFAGDRREWYRRLVALFQPRLKRLVQFAEDARPVLGDGVVPDPAAVSKYLAVPGMAGHLEALATNYRGLEAWTPEALEVTLRQTALDRDVKAGPLIHATRVAVTGRTVSPGLFDVLDLLGPERTFARLDDAIRMNSVQ